VSHPLLNKTAKRLGSPALCALFILSAAPVQAADPEVEGLKQQLSEQQQEIAALRSMIEQLVQQAQGDEPVLQESSISASPQPAVEAVQPSAPSRSFNWTRDAVGDARSDIVEQGGFPAAIRIKGHDDLPVDLAIGGFIKTIAFWDNHSERDDEYFLPALFGLFDEHQDGQFKTSASLSRMHLDARSDVGPGTVRGYLEWEFRNGFNLRHAYLDWSGKYGGLKAGQYWSNFMDLGALPESNIEPLVSGAAFARQAQVRYTSPTMSDVFFILSVEDPSSNDVITESTPLRSRPDFIGTMQWNIADTAHIQLGGLWRDIEVRNDELADTSTDGWGLRAAGAWRITPNHKILGGVTLGDGIGRYLLGLDPVSGGYVDDNGELRSRKAHGGFASYQLKIKPDLRFNVTAGYAEADDDVDLPGDQFRSSSWFAANIFYQISPFLVVSAEYNWGKRENLDGSDLDDQRITLGLQLF
jgi:hypothetical protein